MDQQKSEINNLIQFNENIRKNVTLSLLIYKQINNFDHYNIHHNIINDLTAKSTKSKK